MAQDFFDVGSTSGPSGLATLLTGRLPTHTPQGIIDHVDSHHNEGDASDLKLLPDSVSICRDQIHATFSTAT